VVSLPAAFQESGAALAMSLMAIGVSLTLLSLYYAVRAAQLGGATQFGGLCQPMGRVPRVLAELLTLLVLVGVSASLVRLAVDSLEGLLPHAAASVAATPAFWVCIACVVIVLPLSLTQALLWLQNSSFVAIVALVYVVGLLVFLGAERLSTPSSTKQAPAGAQPGPATGAWASPTLEGALQALPVMIYALGCQVQAVPVFAELPAGARDSPARFTFRVAGLSVFSAGAAYAVAGCFGVFAFGAEGPMTGDVVSQLPSTAAAQAARGMLCLSTMAVLPLLVWPMRRAVAALLLDAGLASRLDEGHPAAGADVGDDGEAGAAGGAAVAQRDQESLLDSSMSPLRPNTLAFGAKAAHAPPSSASTSPNPPSSRSGLRVALPPTGGLEDSLLGDEDGFVVGGAGVAMGFDASPRVPAHRPRTSDRGEAGATAAGDAARPGCRRRLLEPGIVRRLWVSGVVLTLAVVIALAAPSIKAVFQVVGATGAGVMFFIIPPLAFLRLAAWQRAESGPLSDDGAAWPRAAKLVALTASRAPPATKTERKCAWAFLALGVCLCIACTAAVVMGFA